MAASPGSLESLLDVKLRRRRQEYGIRLPGQALLQRREALASYPFQLLPARGVDFHDRERAHFQGTQVVQMPGGDGARADDESSHTLWARRVTSCRSAART